MERAVRKKANNRQKELPKRQKSSLLRAPDRAIRTDGRVVDRARLESVFTVKGNEGSNPSLSAITPIQFTWVGVMALRGGREPCPPGHGFERDLRS